MSENWSDPDLALLSARELEIGYANRVVARGLDVRVHAGELVCLLGPNGAGKSTLLRTLAGLQKARHGAIHINNAELNALSAAQRARSVAVVLTERVEAEHMTARELVALGRQPYTDWSGQLTREDRATIDEALTQTNAMPLADRFIDALSDGERQRVMIARALAQRTPLIILDEPTAFLDLPRRVELMLLLRRLTRESPCAIIASTHDLDLAMRCADRLWVMTHDDFAQGAPEDLALNGVLERRFAGEGVRFDALSGSFQIDVPLCVTVQLVGDGVRAEWTVRALRRNGIAVSAEPQAICVTVRDADWVVRDSTKSLTFDTLAMLISHLTKP